MRHYVDAGTTSHQAEHRLRPHRCLHSTAECSLPPGELLTFLPVLHGWAVQAGLVPLYRAHSFLTQMTDMHMTSAISRFVIRPLASVGLSTRSWTRSALSRPRFCGPQYACDRPPLHYPHTFISTLSGRPLSGARSGRRRGWGHTHFCAIDLRAFCLESRCFWIQCREALTSANITDRMYASAYPWREIRYPGPVWPTGVHRCMPAWRRPPAGSKNTRIRDGTCPSAPAPGQRAV